MVHPNFRRRGIGTSLRQKLLNEATTRGYSVGATHVRIAHGWSDLGEKFYKPYEIRELKNFWPGVKEPDVEFMRFLF